MLNVLFEICVINILITVKIVYNAIGFDIF